MSDASVSLPADLPPGLAEAGRRADGFLPEDEAFALFAAAREAAHVGPLLEVGTYCGKSAIYLAAAARVALGDAAAGWVVTVDHHRGSEEHQPGWEWHDATLWDDEAAAVDTLGRFRRTIHEAGVEAEVVAVVGRSAEVARLWARPLGLVFIDGGHTDEAAQADYQGWAPHVAPGGLLAIHDVFPDPADGGQAPHRIHQRALASGAFDPEPAVGSLRLLRRRTTGDPLA